MSAKQQVAIAKFLHLLKEWDKGSVPVRRKILTEFIQKHQNKTGTQLEEELAHSASLFFTRITSWLRISLVQVFCCCCFYFKLYINQMDIIVYRHFFCKFYL